MNDKEAEGTDVFRFSAMLSSISPFTLPFMHEDEKTDEKTLVKNVLTDMVKTIVKDTQSIIITLFHYELAKFLSYSTIADDGRVVSYSGISSLQANWYSRNRKSRYRQSLIRSGCWGTLVFCSPSVIIIHKPVLGSKSAIC